MHRKRTAAAVLSRVVIYTVLIASALLIAFPYYWMVITSIRPANEVYTTHPTLIPSSVSLGMYQKLLGDPQMPVARFFINSVILSLGATIISTITAILAAYPLARRKVPGGRIAYLLIIATMMVPGEVVLIGMFLVVNAFKMVNTYQGMILPMAVNAIIFLIIYNYILQLPREMDEAALVDGASMWQILRHVIIPLSQPAIYSATLLAFLGAWQNFTIPYLLSQTNSMYPLSVGALFTESTLFATMQETLSLSTLLTIPTLIVFVLTQRFVFSGITTGAVKG
jgi:ABC-type glycerol-3-phosphate transport system permease component